MSAFWIVSGGSSATQHYPTFEQALHDFLDRVVMEGAEAVELRWSA